MIKLLALIGLGGALGSIARYLLSLWIQPDRTAFPLGTLIVNVTGCLAIGILGALFYGPSYDNRPEYRAFFLVGILGGYTTFSSFGRETITLITQHQYTHAAAYILLSNFLGLAAVWVGVRITEHFFSA
jgi:CrcB protein